MGFYPDFKEKTSSLDFTKLSILHHAWVGPSSTLPISLSHQPFLGPTPWAIGGRGLNTSTEVLMRTPRLHQPRLLREPSSMTEPLLPKFRAMEWPPIFGNGFGLRCFQPLSKTAWLPGNALSDNR